MKTFLMRLLSIFGMIVSKIWIVVKKFFRKYPELLTIPTAFTVWVTSIPVLRWFDPTSGVFDAGVFQIPIFSILQLFMYVSVAWLLLGLVFGTARKFLKSELKNAFTYLNPWQKILFSYGLFFSLVFALVALSYTLR